jgi:hypothetical protein
MNWNASEKMASAMSTPPSALASPRMKLGPPYTLFGSRLPGEPFGSALELQREGSDHVSGKERGSTRTRERPPPFVSGNQEDRNVKSATAAPVPSTISSRSPRSLRVPSQVPTTETPSAPYSASNAAGSATTTA